MAGSDEPALDRCELLLCESIRRQRRLFGRPLTGVRSLFDAMDADASGSVSILEWRHALKTLSLAARRTCPAHAMTPDDIEEMTQRMAFDSITEVEDGEIKYALRLATSCAGGSRGPCLPAGRRQSSRRGAGVAAAAHTHARCVLWQAD